MKRGDDACHPLLVSLSRIGRLLLSALVSLIEFVNTSGGIDKLDFACVERMGGVGNLDFHNRVLNAVNHERVLCGSA